MSWRRVAFSRLTPVAADWQNSPTPPVRGIGPGVAFISSPSRVLIRPRASGPSARTPYARGQLDQEPVLLRAEVGAGEHDQAVRALVRRVDDDRAEVGDPDRDHREVEVAGDLADRGGVDHAGHVGAVGGHGQHLAAEPAAQHRVDDAADAVALAVDDDAARAEQPAHRGGLRAVLPALHHPDRGVGGQDRELDDEHAVLHALADPVAGVGEDLGHPPVLRQDLGDEPGDATLARGLREVLEQELGDPAALVGVLDEEGDLGLARARVVVEPVPAADADHLAAQGEDQRDAVDVVDLGEALDVAAAQPRVRARRSAGTSTPATPGRRTPRAARRPRGGSGAAGPSRRRPAARRPPTRAGSPGGPAPAPERRFRRTRVQVIQPG